MPFTLSTWACRQPMPMAAPVGEDLVILGLASNNYIALDPVGRRIWDALATPVPVADLVARLEADFRAEPGQIQADVLAFLAELEREGLVAPHVPDPA